MAAETPNKTNADAARWVARLESGPLSEEEQRELDKWLDATPRHRGALIRARAVWADLDRLAAIAGPEAAEYEPRPWIVRFFGDRPRRAAAVAAGIAMAFLAVPWMMYRGQIIESEIGEVRRVTLEDGSGVTLNSDSRLRVHYRDNARDVGLERGEALFEVAKDKVRPFIVSTGDLQVRALGTAFAVRIADDDVKVTVTEGVVEVARPEEVPKMVTVNERATARPKAPIVVQPIERATAERQLAWRDGMVSFAGESLASAVGEVNRYGRRQIVIDDPRLGAMPVVGIFRVGDVEGFAEAAAAALGAEVYTEDGAIRLKSAAHP